MTDFFLATIGLILDEGHHLEDAATNGLSMSSSALAIQRAFAPLVPRKGVLEHSRSRNKGLPLQDADAKRFLEELQAWIPEMREDLPEHYAALGVELLEKQTEARITPSVLEDERFQKEVEPIPHSLQKGLRSSINRIAALETRIENIEFTVREMQLVKDLGKQEGGSSSTLNGSGGCSKKAERTRCRWAETTGALGSSAKICVAPIEVANLLYTSSGTPPPPS